MDVQKEIEKAMRERAYVGVEMSERCVARLELINLHETKREIYIYFVQHRIDCRYDTCTHAYQTYSFQFVAVVHSIISMQRFAVGAWRC